LEPCPSLATEGRFPPSHILSPFQTSRTFRRKCGPKAPPLSYTSQLEFFPPPLPSSFFIFLISPPPFWKDPGLLNIRASGAPPLPGANIVSFAFPRQRFFCFSVAACRFRKVTASSGIGRPTSFCPAAHSYRPSSQFFQSSDYMV